MVEIGTGNNRKVFYQKYDSNTAWYNGLPTINWLCFAIVSNREPGELDEISIKLINYNTCYVCCADEQGELLHDYTDEEINIRNLGLGEAYLPPFDITEIMTTWHSSIGEGLWFSIYAAYNDPLEIDAVVCLDCTNDNLENQLLNLIERFNQGYLPPD